METHEFKSKELLTELISHHQSGQLMLTCMVKKKIIIMITRQAVFPFP